MVAGNKSNPIQDEPLALAERLAVRFYQWERRGRGWQVWEAPVRPEPLFEPFWGHFIERDGNADDGRRPTLLSRFTQWLSSVIAPAPTPKPPVAEGEDSASREDVEAILAEEAEEIFELQASVPATFAVGPEVLDQFLFNMSGCRHPLAFEVIGLADETVLQIACSRGDVEHVQSQLAAHFPAVVMASRSGFLEDQWIARQEAECVVVEFGLSREFMIPLGGPRSPSVDPLMGIIGAMQNVAGSELAMLQVLFEPVRHPWAASVLRSMVGPGGSAFFESSADMLRQAKAKVSRPLYAAVVRVGCLSGDDRRAWDLARRLTAALSSLSDPLGNELIALSNEGYPSQEHAEDVLLRCCRRSGMILNSTELGSLVHFPSAVVQSSKLKREMQRTKRAPAAVLHHTHILGENEHGGQVQRVTLDADQRVRHTHVIGASGTGKSTFLLRSILQDIDRGEGVAVLDPHGDLIDAILLRIPERRRKDVVLFDPSDEDYPVGFNILSAHSEVEKTLLASDLVGIFRRLSTAWGDQMNAVLANGVLAMLEREQPGTIAELRRFLVEPAYRDEFLRTVRDSNIVYYWRKEFPMLVGKPQGPVLTRLDSFLRPKAIRHMVAQRVNRLDFAEIMDGGRIFLARLSHGAIGEENAHLLGALLVSKFNQLAMGRQHIKESDRRYFWLYIDEFQHFATPSMASLLSGVRKYRLGLILAHQELHQLESRNPEVARAVMGNAYTRVCFRTGDQDARKLAEGFATFEARDLQNLGIGEAICRAERADFDFNLRTAPVGTISESAAAVGRDETIRMSRERYATPRQTVEEELANANDVPEKTAPVARPKVEPQPARDTVQPQEVRPAASAEFAAVPQASAAATGASTSNPASSPGEPALMGRGGPEHKYLQQLIKQWGEGLGYRATIEKEIPGGSIDVLLEKKERSIACETSITTSCEWESGNVRKCLKAGFAHVMMISPDPKKLAKLRNVIEPQLQGDEKGRVKFFVPDELFAYVQELELGAFQQEQTFKGYKIKKTYVAVDGAENVERRQRVSRVVAESLRRLKGKK